MLMTDHRLVCVIKCQWTPSKPRRGGISSWLTHGSIYFDLCLTVPKSYRSKYSIVDNKHWCPAQCENWSTNNLLGWIFSTVGQKDKPVFLDDVWASRWLNSSFLEYVGYVLYIRITDLLDNNLLYNTLVSYIYELYSSHLRLTMEVPTHIFPFIYWYKWCSVAIVFKNIQSRYIVVITARKRNMVSFQIKIIIVSYSW